MREPQADSAQRREGRPGEPSVRGVVRVYKGKCRGNGSGKGRQDRVLAEMKGSRVSLLGLVVLPHTKYVTRQVTLPVRASIPLSMK